MTATYTRWTQNESDYVRDHYALAGASQVARILNAGRDGQTRGFVTPKAVHVHAARLGLAKDPELDALILELAARPQGVRYMDVSSDKTNAFRSFSRLMRPPAQMIRLDVSYKHVVYFIHQEHADAMRRQAEPKIARAAGVSIKHHGRAWWPADAEPYIDPNKPPKITIGGSAPVHYRTNTHSVF